ncbi:MAG TPA: hypothetical protein DDZ51_01015 [Planctomycetaceae bacterium]|nr:hypothetical protein [Planctomycetaceae bacterium]
MAREMIDCETSPWKMDVADRLGFNTRTHNMNQRAEKLGFLALLPVTGRQLIEWKYWVSALINVTIASLSTRE